jgi:hypothetical protein
VTGAGRVQLWRAYCACRACGAGAHPADDWLGVDGYLSPEARCLACLAAASWSFDRAATNLKRFCGLEVCDNTIRACAVAEAAALGRWQEQGPAAAAHFRQAAGDIEFETDGTFVNTREGGWREMRLGLFCKRQRGAAVAPEAWDRRQLPQPQARVAFGGFHTAEECGPLWRQWAARLGITDTHDVTVLGDGAKWIWKQQEQNLPGARGVLDIYHGSEHLYDTAKALYGEAPAEVEPWVRARRLTLLSGGAEALQEQLRAEQRQRRGGAREALQDLIDFWEPHRGHTDYRGRLAAGQSIGSGQIEGACKTVVGRRLKQTGARWLLGHAERLTTLCCLLYSDGWDAYWGANRNETP